MSANVLHEYYRCSERYDSGIAFDFAPVIDALRLERYISADQSSRNALVRLARTMYYAARPLMGVTVRKRLQRAYLTNALKKPFPHWPVDTSVESIMRSLARVALQARGERSMPFVWFWPKRYAGCLLLTHDVETEAGRDFAPQLADIDASFGFKSSFQVVPEKRYEVPESFLDSLRARGCEINVHGLNHDDRMFKSRRIFLEYVEKIKRYASLYGATGFRSPVLYRNLDWYDDLGFSYDMSVPNCAHLDPQPGGCCTVLPYFVGNVLELPLTMTQDYSLFHILREQSIDLWKRQIERVLEHNGLICFNIHPDYINNQRYRSVYYRLLEHLACLREKRMIWSALPGEVDLWWRERQQATPDSYSDRSMLAYARIDSDTLTYDFSETAACMSA